MSGLQAPGGFHVETDDEYVKIMFDPVVGADGYRIMFFRADNPSACFKVRYADRPGKVVRGFHNGTHYLAAICAFTRGEDGTESVGELSDKLEFVTISGTLKAQKKICLKSGETAQIKWEYQNSVPAVSFASNNPEVATVDDSGLVTAVKKGEADIVTSMSENEYVLTSVSVDRDMSPSAAVHGRIVFTGDLMCSYRLQKNAASRRYDFNPGLEGLRDRLSSADVLIGTLETVLCDGAPYESEELRTVSGAPNCNSPSTFINAVKNAGFNYLVTANNHNADCGLEGIKETVSLIKRNKMHNAGTLYDNPVYFEVADTDVALISLSMITNGNDATADNAGMPNPLGRYSEEYCRDLIKEARLNGSELIMVMMHWGNMNSHMVSDEQLEAARNIAEAGADIIVGTHPHLIQRFDYIETSNGRLVPCAYSLGNIITTMNELPGNRDGIALVLDIIKKDDRTDVAYSYIPFYSRLLGNEMRVEAVDIPHGEEQLEAADRIAGDFGDLIPLCRPHIKGIGSVISRRIFQELYNAEIDDEHLMLSIPSFFGEEQSLTERSGFSRVNTDITKSFWNDIHHPIFDYLLIDFYTCASLKLLKLGDTYYTCSNAFKTSAFYQSHEDEFEVIDQPDATDVCVMYLEQFVNELLKRYDHNRIILVRNVVSSRSVKVDQFRNSKAYAALNSRIEWLEELFMIFADPIVIDISSYYMRDYTDGGTNADFEPYYYRDVGDIIDRITGGENIKYYSEPNPRLSIERTLKYYDNMKARGYWKWLCWTGDAADQLIMHTSRKFIAFHTTDILDLRYKHVQSLADVQYIPYISSETKLAAQVIDEIDAGIIPESEEGVLLAIKYEFNELSRMNELLSIYYDLPVSTAECLDAYRLRHEKDKFLYEVARPKYDLDIWGSCISRTSVGRNEDLVVKNYIFKQPAILAYKPPIDIPIPQDVSMFGDNVWRMKAIASSLTHNGIQRIRESSAGWIVVDLYDLINEAATIGDDHFELDDFIRSTKFYKKSVKKYPTGYLFNEIDRSVAMAEFTRFANELRNKYGRNIILVIADLKNTYIDLDGSKKDLPEDTEYEAKVEYIKHFEDFFARQTKCHVIDISKNYDASDAFPLGGAHIVHYEDAFYTELCKYITDIITNSR